LVIASRESAPVFTAAPDAPDAACNEQVNQVMQVNQVAFQQFQTMLNHKQHMHMTWEMTSGIHKTIISKFKLLQLADTGTTQRLWLFQGLKLT